MDNIKLEEIVKSFNPEAEIKQGKHYLEVTVSPESLHSLAQYIRDNEKTRFDFLFCLTGIDYGKDLGVVYHLRSTVLNHTIVLKTRVSDRKSPLIDSVSDIWKTADLHEREVFDLLGIKFSNHPDLRRLFLDNSWGYPLRKDYIDDSNIVTR